MAPGHGGKLSNSQHRESRPSHGRRHPARHPASPVRTPQRCSPSDRQERPVTQAEEHIRAAMSQFLRAGRSQKVHLAPGRRDLQAKALRVGIEYDPVLETGGFASTVRFVNLATIGRPPYALRRQSSNHPAVTRQ